MSTVDLILPPRCPVTGDIVDVQGMISPQAWREIAFISQPRCDCCGIPMEFEGDDLTCVECLDNRPKFEKARAAVVYNDASRNLILGFKHGDKTHTIQAFIPWLMKAGHEILYDADYLISVPLHPYRLIARRYNQAALLADSLSGICGVKHLPFALRRVRSTPSQGHLSYSDRFRNVRSAFEVSMPYKAVLKDKKIVLIDDVYTTGATASECTKSLLQEGVASVRVLTLARVLQSNL